MRKYEKIRRIGHRDNEELFDSGYIAVQEKMDGANFRIYINEDRELSFGSRNIDYRNVPDEDVDKNFRPAIEYIRDSARLTAVYDVVNNYGPVTLFGEAMHKHELDYDWDSTPRVLGFDVYSHLKDEYLQWTIAEEIFNRLNIETAPVLDFGPVDEITPSDYEEIESSYRDGIAEGVVFKNHSTQTRAKLITEAFAERKKNAKAGAQAGVPETKRCSCRNTSATTIAESRRS
ncbi:RNA ligase family protein [Halocatena marina]|uniref:RNA ligase family protein n=1 Tax=Halocatena marina TaxID=2934937 RepID=A0ABD5YRF1_9EURY